MSTTTQRVGRFETLRPWQRGVLAGLVGGVVMGAAFVLLMPGLLGTAIPALVGLSGAAAGWVVHLSISAVFGVGFAAILQRMPAYGASVSSSVATGVTYGVVLWVLAAGIVMPVWLSAVGFPNAPGVPNLAAAGFTTHVVFGAVLGAAYRLFGPRR
jgi:hypothetical protein